MKHANEITRIRELHVRMSTLKSMYESLDDRTFTTIEEAVEAAEFNPNLNDPDIKVERDYMSLIHDYMCIDDEIASIEAFIVLN